MEYATFFKSCIASLLELDYDDVPNFIEFGRSHWWAEAYKFLNKHGYDLRGYSSHQKNKPSLESFAGVDGYIIVSGPSLRYTDKTHGVIYKDGKLAHDPHPSNDGVPKVNGFYMIVQQDKNEN